MATQKVNKTAQIHWLLTLMGIALIICSIASDKLFNNTLSISLGAVGGALLGVGASWLIAEKYKDRDERETALELFAKIASLLEATINSKNNRSFEKLTKIFRSTNLHLYHQTQSEDGRLFWHSTILDFRLKKAIRIGKLVTEVDFYNLQRTKKSKRQAEISKKTANDHTILRLYNQNGQESSSIAIFDSCKQQKDNCGFMVLDDWSDNYRLSACILSFEPIIETSFGPVSREEATRLQEIWNKEFKDVSYRKIFEEFN